MENALFYFFSGAMLFFGLMTITSRNPVNSAMFLVLVFFFMAGLFVLLHAFFLAAVQVLVYAGAIMVLFLFVIMLLNAADEEKRRRHWLGVIASAVVVGLLVFEFGFVLWSGNLDTVLPSLDAVGQTEAVGRLLFSSYLLPFEIVSVLLLAAMIGVIILGGKEKKA
ncbi:MAG: NADH-quinone oxidoreductase subunit J [Verrucomicrobia bacterium]|nr:NADH-quinone oxidoreductase subunit J [Verrucomicrobiota bacterium]